MTSTPALAARRQRTSASLFVAVVSTLIAALMHTAAGGSTPSIVAVALALMLSIGFGMLFVGRTLSRRRTAAGVAVDQLLFHGLFAFFGSAAPVTALAVPSGTSAHDHTLPHALTSDALTSSTVTGVASPVAVMIAAHLVAAIASYALIRVGVSAVATSSAALLGAIVRALRVPLAPVAMRARRLVARGEHPEPLRGADAVRIPDRRGPPVWSVA